jgi:putative transposase
MKKPSFAEGQVYHVFNRGVEKRDIFLDDKDYLRFIHDLYDFNDINPVRNLHYFINHKTGNVEARKLYGYHEREPTVEILVFTLMPNHYHLMLRQIKDDGIVKFMHKLGTGYTMYFNKRYSRVGSLFQGRFKAVHLTREEHFIHLPYYIHTNPYRGSTSIDDLEDYRWSSFPDYIGMKNYPSVTEREDLLDIFGGAEQFRLYMQNRLRQGDDSMDQHIEGLTLE